jgi:membrane protein
MDKKSLWALFKTSFKEWQADNAVQRAAALTFFTILPLPSLLLIEVSIFAQFYGQTQATQQLIQQITALAGPAVAGLFSQLLSGATSPFTSAWTSITLVIFSLAGAIGAFAVLRDTMDLIWEFKLPMKQRLTSRIKQRIGPFVLVSSLGLIVIVWTGFAATLFSAIKQYSINGTLTLIAITVAQILLSFGLSTMLFAIIYKVIPQAKVHWSDVALPSIIGGIAFTATNYIIGSYMQIFTITTVVGAAGSLMILLIWIFILNQIVLYGAEVSKVYALTFGPHPKQHLPSTIEKILKPIEEIEEKIEQEVKGDSIETPAEAVAEPKAKKRSKRNREKRSN